MRRPVSRFILLFSAVLFIVSVPGFSSQLGDSTLANEVMDYTRTGNYEIKEINITGVEFIDPGYLKSIAGVNVGEIIEIPGERTTRIVRNYWHQGLFSDVKLFYTPAEGNKIVLEIYLKERPRISEIQITGVRKGEKEDLNEKISLKRGSQITDDLLNNTALILKRHYIDKGFYNVDVEMVQQPDTALANRVKLQINVSKHARVKIKDIVIEGNQAYEDKRIRRVLKKTKKRNLNIFKSSKLISADFKEDKQKLAEFYNENGYRDFKLVRDSVAIYNRKRVTLYLTLHEGQKYYFRNITWVGNTKYPAELLNSILKIKKGDVYDKSHLDKRLSIDEDAVTSLYMDNGYLFFSVDPVEANIEGDSIDLEMRIYEGKQATLNDIIIKGNTKTNEHVIRRELRTNPGELFSKSDIIRSVRELATLGHFNPETIAPNPIPNPMDGTVDMEYGLEEKANDQLEISGGWGAKMFVGTVGIRFSNFSIRNIHRLKTWRPVPSGDGQTLSLRAQTNGKYYQSYSISFVEPWFGGKKPNSFSVSFFHSILNPSNYSYYNRSSDQPESFMKTTGGSIGLGRRLRWPDDFFVLYNSVNFQHYNLKNYSGYFQFLNSGVSNNLSLTTSLTRNSQDQVIFPRRGSNYSLSLTLTPPYSWFKPDKFWEIPDGDYSSLTEAEKANRIYQERLAESAEHYKWIEYHKWVFKGYNYLSIVGNLVLSSRVEYGFLGRYSKNWGYSPFEAFVMGGDGFTGYRRYGTDIVGLRGYENSSLTPSGYNAGNVYSKYVLELRYPFSLNPSATIYGLGFFDAGNSWYNIEEFNPFIVKRSLGVGLRAFLPMFGMLGVDWGYGFDEPTPGAGISGGQFHFVLGQEF